jgi:hypothetical protein
MTVLTWNRGPADDNPGSFACCAPEGAAVRAENEITATTGGRGRLRASDGDRDRVLEMLKTAFVQGRLTKDELDVRVGQTLDSRTWADLATLTADIPAWAIQRPARGAARTHSTPPTPAVIRAVACAIIALGAIVLAGMPGIWTIPAPASMTAQACQTYFSWGGPKVGSISTLEIAAVTASNGSDPKLAVDLGTLLAAVHRSEVVSSSRESSAIRDVVGHQTQTWIGRVQSDCLADGSPPRAP